MSFAPTAKRQLHAGAFPAYDFCPMTAALVTSHWDDRACKDFTEEQLLLYRSNLLGADLRITNFAGGNTSAKLKGRIR